MSTPGPVDAALIALLSDPVTAKLSDDELARRAGCANLGGGQYYVMTFRLEFANARRYLENNAERNPDDSKPITPDDVWRVMGLSYIFQKDLLESGGYSESELEEIINHFKKWRADRAKEDAFRAAHGLPPRTTIKPLSTAKQEERDRKAALKAAKVAGRERLRTAKAAAKAEAKAAKARAKAIRKTGGQQLDIEDVTKNSA